MRIRFEKISRLQPDGVQAKLIFDCYLSRSSLVPTLVLAERDDNDIEIMDFPEESIKFAASAFGLSPHKVKILYLEFDPNKVKAGYLLKGITSDYQLVELPQTQQSGLISAILEDHNISPSKIFMI